MTGTEKAMLIKALGTSVSSQWKGGKSRHEDENDGEKNERKGKKGEKRGNQEGNEVKWKQYITVERWRERNVRCEDGNKR